MCEVLPFNAVFVMQLTGHQPPTSTLFPYTTLFRSNWGASYLVNDFYRRFVRRDASEPHYVLASRLATALDRKSTRLNSSHANTSYAVFCLKKKTPRTTKV